MSVGVGSEYETRRDAAEASRAAALVTDGQIANWRMVVFLAGLVIAAFVISESLPWSWLAVPILGFVVLVAAHARVDRARRAAERRMAFYERGLARLDGSWPALSDDESGGVRFRDPEHPYADHLDIFGRGSLFALLSSTRTPHGASTLAGWLKAPGAPDEIRRRHAAVRELTPALDLREDVALLGDEAIGAAGLGGLEDWGEREPALAGGAARWLAHLMPLPTVVLIVLTFTGSVPVWAPVLSFAVGTVIFRRASGRVSKALHGVVGATHELGLLSGLLERLEAESFESALLAEIHDALASEGATASRRIHDLERLVDANDWAKNQLFAPVAIILFWPLQMAYLIEDWRKRHGPQLRTWLQAVATFEALSSIAGHAAENPSDVFPEVVDDGPVFEAVGVTHPLLSRDRAVTNDVTLDDGHRVLVVSGSNMSGKSTLLRTVGINAALALAGAPVRAARLRISPVMVAASIHVHDSLLDGESRFYAEVSRIGRIVSIAKDHDIPELFLLDELFHGTNSHDRRIGAAAVVRTLAEHGAIGLVTTHDLELARLAEDIGETVRNVHFEDQFDDGRMTFDYRMREGPVQRSNALALMRAVGLDV